MQVKRISRSRECTREFHGQNPKSAKVNDTHKCLIEYYNEEQNAGLDRKKILRF